MNFKIKLGMTALASSEKFQIDNTIFFDTTNNFPLEEQLLTNVVNLMMSAHSDVIGLVRNTGSGDEYVFFSKTAINVLNVEQLAVWQKVIKVVEGELFQIR